MSTWRLGPRTSREQDAFVCRGTRPTRSSIQSHTNTTSANMDALVWIFTNLCICVHKGGFHHGHHHEDGGVRDVPARTATYLHSAIMELLTRILVQMHVQSKRDSNYGEVLTDDASLAKCWFHMLASGPRIVAYHRLRALL